MDRSATQGEGGGQAASGPATSAPSIVDPAEHNVVFTTLVTADNDIVGLVAYSIYKQNKYDWLQAYGRAEGRMPDAAEAQSYLLGESTPRRLATYRHLAEAVLAGRGPDVSGEAAPGLPARRAGAAPSAAAVATRPEPPRRRVGLRPDTRVIVGLCVALLVLVALFWLLSRGAPLPPK